MGLFIFCQLFAVNRDEIEYSTLQHASLTVTTARKFGSFRGCADQLFGVSAHFKDSSYHKHRLLPRSTCNLVTICAFAQMTEHHVTKQK